MARYSKAVGGYCGLSLCLAGRDRTPCTTRAPHCLCDLIAARDDASAIAARDWIARDSEILARPLAKGGLSRSDGSAGCVKALSFPGGIGEASLAFEASRQA